MFLAKTPTANKRFDKNCKSYLFKLIHFLLCYCATRYICGIREWWYWILRIPQSTCWRLNSTVLWASMVWFLDNVSISVETRCVRYGSFIRCCILCYYFISFSQSNFRATFLARHTFMCSLSCVKLNVNNNCVYNIKRNKIIKLCHKTGYICDSKC